MRAQLYAEFQRLSRQAQKRLIMNVGTAWSNPEYTRQPAGDLFFVVDGSSYMSTVVEVANKDKGIQLLSSAAFIQPRFYVVATELLERELNTSTHSAPSPV